METTLPTTRPFRSPFAPSIGITHRYRRRRHGRRDIYLPLRTRRWVQAHRFEPYHSYLQLPGQIYSVNGAGSWKKRMLRPCFSSDILQLLARLQAFAPNSHAALYPILISFIPSFNPSDQTWWTTARAGHHESSHQHHILSPVVHKPTDWNPNAVYRFKGQVHS